MCNPVTVHDRLPCDLRHLTGPLSFLYLGRPLYHYNSATQTHRASGTSAKQPENFVEMHPRDGRQQKVDHQDRVRVISRRGEVEAAVHVTRKLQPGCVWMPFHFAEQSANRLTNDAGGPVTDTAEFKVCAVRIETLAAAP